MVSAPYGQASRTQLPRANNLDSTGVIYTCPIGPGNCVGLTGDGNGYDRRLYDLDGESVITTMYRISKHVSNPVYVLTQNLRKTNIRNPMRM